MINQAKKGADGRILITKTSLKHIHYQQPANSTTKPATMTIHAKKSP
jgi:hypothetical protein